jgi:hypothetical protein
MIIALNHHKMKQQVIILQYKQYTDWQWFFGLEKKGRIFMWNVLEK